MEEDFIHLKISSSELNEETKCKNFKSSKIISIYLEKIFQLCKKEKIDVEFYFMPMNESSYKELKPKFIKEYKSYIKEYQKKYPKFNISDSMFFYKDIFFGDASHLNKNGKKVFTSNFIKNHFKK